MSKLLHGIPLTGIVLSLFLVAEIAHASIGKAVAVIQQAVVFRDTRDSVLDVGKPVFAGDLLKSGPIGLAQLVFTDDTRLVVGPNSSLRIDTYLLRNQDRVKDLSISALRGSFRFLSGNSPSKAYTIATTNATIGVRGTAFDISSRADASGVLTYAGKVTICDLKKQCATARPGDLYDVGTNGELRLIDDPAEKLAYIKAYFPFAFDQSALLSMFWVNLSVWHANLEEEFGRPSAGSPG